jgi:NadR type nicotinamide-nucleotide adenylyltransferase
MAGGNKIKRIVITGPESTGKTELARILAQKLNANWVPEYARQYVENLNRPYGYNDVIKIARHQIAEEKEFTLKVGSGLVIFDTWLIITKVWLDLVFNRCPVWISEHIRASKIDLFLVCYPDLPWIADQVRENGGEKREQLFHLYCDEIRSFGFNYEIIDGSGPLREERAMSALIKFGLNQ